MILDLFEKIKKTHLSDAFQNWMSTLLLLPLAIYFRFIIGTYYVLDKDFDSLYRSVLFLGLIICVWLVWKWLFDDRVILTGLEAYLGGFFIIACLSTVFSANISLSIEKLIGISAYLFSIYLLIDIKRSPRFWQGTINTFLITAGLSSFLILVTALPWIKLYQVTPLDILARPAYLLEIIPRLPYSLGLHQSVTAGYLVLILPLAIYQLSQSKKLVWKFIQSIGIILNITILFLTQSRGGLLGLSCLVLVTIILYRRRIWTFILKNRSIGIVTVSSLVLAGTGFIYFIGKSRGFSLSGRTVQMRFNQWRIALQIIQEHPWFGSGLGTFGQKYLALRDPDFFAGTFIHAHNQIIQITTELGILGLISLLLLTWQGIRILRNVPGRLLTKTKVALIALGGLFGVLIPDAILTSSMIVLLVLFYLVWILPTEKSTSTLNKVRGMSFLSLAAVLLAGSAGWILWKIQPYDVALQAAEQGNWQDASAALFTAIERDPNNPYYQHALGFTNGQVACQDEGNGSLAADYYETSFDTYQNWGIDHANIAVLFSRDGEFQNAADHMEEAIQNLPQNYFFSCLLGDYYTQLGKPENALEAYTYCVEKSPNFLDSPYWQEDKNRKELMPAVFTQVESNLKTQTNSEANHLLAELYFAIGDLENSEIIIRDILIQNTNDLRGNLLHFKILESAGDLPIAKEKIEQLLLSHPRSSALWLYQGKLIQQEGFDENAEIALTLGYRLEPSPENSWLLGQYYQTQGDLQKAQEYFIFALRSTASPMMDFSRRVAGRWPLPGEYLDCMPTMRTYHDYFTPALSTARALENEDCNMAACIYQELVNLEPTIEVAEIRLESLICPWTIDEYDCFNEVTN